MIRQPVFDDAQRLFVAGADIEMILLFLRDNGFDKIDSINTIRTLSGKTTREVKDLVDNSNAWSDRFYSDQDVHEKARRIFEEFASSGEKSIPQILLDWNSEIDEM